MTRNFAALTLNTQYLLSQKISCGGRHALRSRAKIPRRGSVPGGASAGGLAGHLSVRCRSKSISTSATPCGTSRQRTKPCGCGGSVSRTSSPTKARRSTPPRRRAKRSNCRCTTATTRLASGPICCEVWGSSLWPRFANAASISTLFGRERRSKSRWIRSRVSARTWNWKSSRMKRASRPPKPASSPWPWPSASPTRSVAAIWSFC